ncbi:mRNA capping enzyme [Tricholoma matsutake]|nr:mRNA capping enzyme [Tricholoma matsutake 945]
MPKIPELPGALVTQHEQQQWLKHLVARICKMDNPKFPGSQPVSFSEKDLAKLERQDYWVCEKSDGIRVLLLVYTDTSSKDQAVYLIDRHNDYRQLTGIFFPHHENPAFPLRSTLVDGELVIDTDPRTKQETLRFLAFDCLVVDDQNVMSRTLDKRYGRLSEWFYKPYARMLREYPQMIESQPFDIKVKEINFSYHVEKVFNVDIPALQHGHDGLIYTCVSTPYTPGTDENILKWKPPSENSVDFKLVLRFPSCPSQPDKPDFLAKPVFLLHVWCGGPTYELYDEMYVEDDEWEKMKLTGEQIDDRTVEVRWDPSLSRWRMMRFRDDKPNGNHRDVVEKIIQSIVDGVEKDILLKCSNTIRNAWKARLNQPQHQPPYPPAASRAPPPAPKPPVPHVEYRYGPLAPSPWSKVGGPPVVAGMKR